jgi:hypothetical protein
MAAKAMFPRSVKLCDGGRSSRMEVRISLRRAEESRFRRTIQYELEIDLNVEDVL